MWATDVNKDVGFKFSLREELKTGEKVEDRDLQLRDFNVANFNQSTAAAATSCLLNAEENILTSKSQEPKGSHQQKKVMFLWTLSVPPLAPLVYGRLGGSFF